MTYFDAASGEPVHRVAREALLAALDEGWADPARLYRDGRRARLLLDAARATVAEIVGARPDEVFFTASGTAAVHAGVLGVARGRRRVGTRVVVSAVEHSSVLHAAEWLGRVEPGGETVTVRVDRAGRVDAGEFAAAAAGPGVAVACVQAANHEVGTVQPIAEIAALLREQRSSVPLLVDAAQVLGRVAVPGGWSVLTASAHKWGGPPGVGVLVVRKGVRLAPAWPVDERESGVVPGYGNLPAIVGAAASLRAREAERVAEAPRLAELVDRVRAVVAERVPGAVVVGDPVRRLPNIVTFSCPDLNGEALLLDLDEAGFAVSSGSACTAETITPSHVLEAMGVPSRGNVRVSLPFATDAADVERFLDVLPGIVEKLRASADLASGASGSAGTGGVAAPSKS
jgi:cysteine desulfurase